MARTLELNSEKAAQVRALALEEVERLTVSEYGRPGEPKFWLALLYVAGMRHAVSTVELRIDPLEEQWRPFLERLAGFEVQPVSPRNGGLLPGVDPTSN